MVLYCRKLIENNIGTGKKSIKVGLVLKKKPDMNGVTVLKRVCVVSQEGGVFTFGAGGYGQLGHNCTNHEINPRKVFELMGNAVTQISCGR